MIIVKLMGGLGNQMFQYAAGRCLAVANKDTLKMDLNYYRNQPVGDVPRKYELNNFKIVAEIATDEEILNLKPKNHFSKMLSHIKQSIGISHTSSFIEPHFNYCEKFHDIKTDVYLNGYWQSAKYFENIEYLIREELHPVFSGRQDTVELLRRISSSNSLCINVRRTDFLNNKFLGYMDIDYYLEALTVMGKMVGNTNKYIFSDDICWCREKFGNMPNTTVVGHEYAGIDFIDYLYLMHSCKHFIIPNSSFAWWAAWLSTNPGKQIIAPLCWFNDSSIDSSDIVPDTWIRI